MPSQCSKASRFCLLAALLLAVGLSTGCRNWAGLRPVPARAVGAEPIFVPAELNMVSLPPYTIEPPDILLIDALRIIPKAPFRIQPLDLLQVEVEGTGVGTEIRGLYLVEPGGMLNLGPLYGKVKVGNLSLEEATAAVTRHLKRILAEPQVSLTLNESGGQQQIAGEHLVGPDGMVNLGTYGMVYVAGMTINEAKRAIEEHLSQHLEAPLVSVDVFAYNSKVYYVITQGAGFGDNILRFPVTGNETVLDAVSQVQGLSRMSSKNIWIARPAPGGYGCEQVLPVNYDAITRGAVTATNYQILPGDRVFIDDDKILAFQATISKIIGPFERMLGFTSLTASAIRGTQLIGIRRSVY